LRKTQGRFRAILAQQGSAPEQILRVGRLEFEQNTSKTRLAHQVHSETKHAVSLWRGIAFNNKKRQQESVTYL
jgi:hypothetical protein